MTKRIITPFASSGDKNTVPDTAPGVDNGFANYPAGFPPSNSIDPALGGYYVKRADINGVLNDTTTILRDLAKGLLYTYDATYSTAIGGYPVNAILAKAGLIGFWLNITASNTTDPDSGGAGWIDFSPKAIQNGAYTFAAAGGSTIAYTATLSPAPLALTDGMEVSVDTTAIGTNTTTTTTFNLNALGAKSVVKGTNLALRAQDMPSLAKLKYNLALDKWILMNPDTGTSGLIASNIQTVTATGSIPTTIAGGTLVINVATANTQTLPAANSLAAGKRIEIFNINSGIASITRAGTDTLRVNATTTTVITMGAGDSLTLETDGSSSWYAVGGTAQFKYAPDFFLSNTASPLYRKSPDGVIMQLLQITASGGTGGGTATLPITYPNNNILTFGSLNNTARLNFSVTAGAISTSQVCAYASISNTGAAAADGTIINVLSFGR